MRVQAAVAYQGRDRFAIEQLDLSDPGPDNILVRIAGVGLCHTDVKALEGAMRVPKPSVLGHEGAGVVEWVGERVVTLKPRDHVVLTYDSCRSCHACAGGNPAYCEQTASLNFHDARENEPGFFRKGSERIHGHFFGQSSFAHHAMAREQNTIRVRKDAPLEILGTLGCGVQTGAGAIMNSLAARSGESVVIFGVGPVGLSAVMAAVVCGCAPIVAVDALESRLSIAKHLGAAHTVLVSSGFEVAEEIRKLVSGGVNLALDTTGRAENYHLALASLATKGRFGFLTLPSAAFEPHLASIFLRGLTMRGIVQGDSVPHEFIPRLIDLYMDGRFPFDKLVTKYSLDKINHAIEDQAAGRVVKPVFTFDS